MARRRRKSYEKRKPIAAASIWASIIGLLCFLVVLILLLLAASGESLGKLPGAVGVIIMLLSIITTTVGIKTSRESDYDIFTRIVGVVMPALSMVVLLVVYFLGILFG